MELCVKKIKQINNVQNQVQNQVWNQVLESGSESGSESWNMENCLWLNINLWSNFNPI